MCDWKDPKWAKNIFIKPNGSIYLQTALSTQAGNRIAFKKYSGTKHHRACWADRYLTEM